jgi:hypothetical protein
MKTRFQTSSQRGQFSEWSGMQCGPFAELGAAIEMDLRARAARPRLGHPPEVGVVTGFDVAPAGDALRTDPDLVVPDVVGLVVVLVDGDADPIGRDLVDLGQELPGPMDRFALEVVAEAPVAEHLEEGVVPRRAADLFEVVVLAGHAQAALVVGRADVAALLAAGQDVLELDHPGVGEEQRLVAGRHERGARHLGVTALGEELDVAAAHFGRGEVGNRQVRHRH